MPARRGYFDTSVLVKLYVEEPGTMQARALTGRYLILSSAIAPVEFVGAVRRHRSEGQLSAEEHEWILARFGEDRLFWTLIELAGPVLERAEALTRSRSVKTLDALHVASALVLQAETGVRIPFVTADEQQRRVAAEEGLNVVFVR